MIKALARAFWWRKVLDEGVYATLDDLAKARGIGKAYVSQVLRLTLLAPDMVEAILERRQPPELQLNDLLAGFPPHWKHQIENFGTLTRSGDTKLDQSIDAIKAAA